MTYDEALAGRIRRAVAHHGDVTEKAMFGGLTFLRGGNMFVGVVKDDLMVRVGKGRHEEALRRPHVRPMDFVGRPMEGYVYVARPGTERAKDVAAWCVWALEAIADLPAKAKKTAKARPARRS